MYRRLRNRKGHRNPYHQLSLWPRNMNIQVRVKRRFTAII
jgi:hypothetical protein